MEFCVRCRQQLFIHYNFLLRAAIQICWFGAQCGQWCASMIRPKRMGRTEAKIVWKQIWWKRYGRMGKWLVIEFRREDKAIIQFRRQIMCSIWMMNVYISILRAARRENPFWSLSFRWAFFAWFFCAYSFIYWETMSHWEPNNSVINCISHRVRECSRCFDALYLVSAKESEI